MKKSLGFGKSTTSSKAVASAIGVAALTLLLIPYIYQYENVNKLMGASREHEPELIHWKISESWPPSSVISKVTKGGENRVVIASFNCQNLQFADNWANSLLSQDTHNFIFVPLDKSTEEILLKAYPENTVPMLPGVEDDDLNGFAKFGTQEFKRLTSGRPRMINAFLRHNVTVLYNDVDIVWKTKVWDELDAIVNDSDDEVEAIFQEDGGDRHICTCIIFMVPGQANFRLLENWQHAIDTGKYSYDQKAFNEALRADHGVKWKRLPVELFPSGKEYFQYNEREGVHVVHANYMKGHTTKYTRLKYSDNWHPTGRLDNMLPRCAIIPEDPVETSIETKMYKADVTSLMEEKKTVCMKPPEAALDMAMAISCLQLTTPSLELEYPSDADLHLNEIRLALAPWAQHGSHKPHSHAGYDGPWIENRWITHFENIYQGNKTACASDIFGPFIPIFIPWTDHWVDNKMQYQNLLDRLSDVLRPNVPYITVSQNAQGLPGGKNFDLRQFPNLLILSAGGYGHIPIPLLKQQEKKMNQKKTMSERSSLLSFAGSLSTAPLRQEMHNYLSAVDHSRINNGSNVTQVYKYYKGEQWRDVMLSSQLSMCPRGFGRTSFRLTEALQLGLIPIYIYSDVTWVPYADLFNQIGFTANMTSIRQLVDELLETPVSQLEEMEKRVAILAKSHFSPEGILHQTGLFMTGNRNDLRCQKIPATIRGY